MIPHDGGDGVDECTGGGGLDAFALNPIAGGSTCETIN